MALDPFGAKIFVARTLPGEFVRVSAASPGRATLVAVLTPSAERGEPPCPHFAELCGGCAVQHLRDAAYADWKRGLVVAALERAGFVAPEVGPLLRTPPGQRRRMDFAVRRRDGGVHLGLHEAHGTRIVDLLTCHVLHPSLLGLLAPLRTVLSSLSALGHAGSVLANLPPTGGADLLIRTDRGLSTQDRTKLAAFAAAHRVGRIAWAEEGGTAAAETAAQSGAPFAVFGGVRVDLAAGAFLQASAEGEAAIVAAVLAEVPEKRTARAHAIELYAGLGTIGFPLSRHLRVEAYEGDAEAAAAVRRAQGGTRMTMTTRDLVRQPLPPKALAGAAMIVLDPPYAGAALQMGAIAESRVARVVYVSCNPGALAKDAAVLFRAGYRLRRATPIDQFLWSAHVECVASFEKANTPRPSPASIPRTKK